MHELLETYVSEVGRRVPAKRREWVEAEARRLIDEALTDHHVEAPTDDEAIEVLSEIGSPRHTASDLWPQGQYLIGPALYPVFRIVAWIVVGVTAGAVAMGWVVSALFADATWTFPEGALGFLNAIPAAFGAVVLVFALLQRFEVAPEPEIGQWDAHALLPMMTTEPVKAGERIAGITISLLLLLLVAIFPDRLGIVESPGGEFFANPLIGDYLWWIVVALVAGLALDAYLLVRRHWDLPTRAVKVIVNLFTFGVLAFLVNAHIGWLNDAGANWFLAGYPDGISGFEVSQIVGMQGFNLGFTIAAIVIAIESIMLIRRGFLASSRR